MITTTSTLLLGGCDIALCFLNIGNTVPITHTKSFKCQTVRSIQSLKYTNSINYQLTDYRLLKQADNKKQGLQPQRVESSVPQKIQSHTEANTQN